MWNILIVLIIAIIIFMINPIKSISHFGVQNQDLKNKNEINSVLNETKKQIDTSKYYQQNNLNPSIK